MIGICLVCNKEFNYYPSNSSGKYCSRQCSHKCSIWLEKQAKAKTGRKISKETRKKMSIARKGKKHTSEHIDKRISKMKVTKRKQRQEKLKTLTGTMSDYPLYKQVRASPYYRRWRLEVLERDNNECTSCGGKETLEVDHIIPFASLFHEAQILNDVTIIFDVDNGRVLCKECHVKTGTYCQKKNKQKEYQLMVEIEKNWKQEGSRGTFENYYLEKMNKIIDAYKGRID